ncbi:hypothetical protein [Acidithiobacillus concretivorus]|uniref:Uncharacterized protein n=1 Tax=Acidithiobacillus concretivorus TaxID=3063952 RepID=A0ABS5ZUE8_9PROT|nr:hypothetical protein [Acidithiobacillus concretivorus]MBU2739589.1 hypothetical protein [Acidithiobacillus concretivorus]
MNTNLPRSPEIARNADFKDGYAEGIRDASAIAMKMPLSKEWTEITDRISDTTVQAMAWRTSMAILKKLPKPDATVNPDTAGAILENARYTVQIGTTLDSLKDRFAQELLNLLADYPEIFVFGREHEYGIGCGVELQLKLMNLAKTDAERTAAMNVVGVSYRPC